MMRLKRYARLFSPEYVPQTQEVLVLTTHLCGTNTVDLCAILSRAPRFGGAAKPALSWEIPGRFPNNVGHLIQQP